MTELPSWTYRDHAAGWDRVAAEAVVVKRALAGVPNASVEVLSSRRTATGWSFEIRRVREVQS